MRGSFGRQHDVAAERLGVRGKRICQTEDHSLDLPATVHFNDGGQSTSQAHRSTSQGRQHVAGSTSQARRRPSQILPVVLPVAGPRCVSDAYSHSAPRHAQHEYACTPGSPHPKFPRKDTCRAQHERHTSFVIDRRPNAQHRTDCASIGDSAAITVYWSEGVRSNILTISL
eukprot:2502734-Prymnesium_polylepis.3